MKVEIQIKSNQPAMYSFMKADAPKGILLKVNTPIIEKRDISINASIEFIVQIDITRITIDAALLYLISRGRALSSKTYACVNRKQIPIDDSNAKNIIAKEIENKTND